MNKLTKNKKGSSYTFIYILAFMFMLSILYVIFDQILKVYMYPTTVYLASDVLTGTAKADKFLGFWGFVPYIIILVTLLYWFFKSTQKSDNNFQG